MYIFALKLSENNVINILYICKFVKKIIISLLLLLTKMLAGFVVASVGGDKIFQPKKMCVLYVMW